MAPNKIPPSLFTEYTSMLQRYRVCLSGCGMWYELVCMSVFIARFLRCQLHQCCKRYTRLSFTKDTEFISFAMCQWSLFIFTEPRTKHERLPLHEAMHQRNFKTLIIFYRLNVLLELIYQNSFTYRSITKRNMFVKNYIICNCLSDRMTAFRVIIRCRNKYSVLRT